jgi:hypothetical protein
MLLRFLFQRLGMRTLAEGSTNSPRAKRTQRGQGLRRSRNPKGVEGNEVTESSHPTLPQQRGIKNIPLMLLRFLFQRLGLRTLAEGSTNSPRAKRTQASLGLRRSRNPEGGEGNEETESSHPSHSQQSGMWKNIPHVASLFVSRARDENPRRGFD